VNTFSKSMRIYTSYNDFNASFRMTQIRCYLSGCVYKTATSICMRYVLLEGVSHGRGEFVFAQMRNKPQ